MFRYKTLVTVLSLIPLSNAAWAIPVPLTNDPSLSFHLADAEIGDQLFVEYEAEKNYALTQFELPTLTPQEQRLKDLADSADFKEQPRLQQEFASILMLHWRKSVLKVTPFFNQFDPLDFLVDENQTTAEVEIDQEQKILRLIRNYLFLSANAGNQQAYSKSICFLSAGLGGPQRKSLARWIACRGHLENNHCCTLHFAAMLKSGFGGPGNFDLAWSILNPTPLTQSLSQTIEPEDETKTGTAAGYIYEGSTPRCDLIPAFTEIKDEGFFYRIVRINPLEDSSEDGLNIKL
jgi:hypothetical protein